MGDSQEGDVYARVADNSSISVDTAEDYTLAELQEDLAYIIDSEELEQDLAKIIEEEGKLENKKDTKDDEEANLPNDDGSKKQARRIKGVDKIGSGEGEDQEIIIEVINASSATVNRLALLESDAHVQFVQETCLTKGLQATFDKEAKEYHKKAIGSPLDPEHSKATAGVAVIAVEGLNFYQLPNPTDDYKDAEKLGRCKIYCVDIAGQTLACANIYGWSGGIKGLQRGGANGRHPGYSQDAVQKAPPGTKAHLWRPECPTWMPPKS